MMSLMMIIIIKRWTGLFLGGRGFGERRRKASPMMLMLQELRLESDHEGYNVWRLPFHPDEMGTKGWSSFPGEGMVPSLPLLWGLGLGEALATNTDQAAQCTFLLLCRLTVATQTRVSKQTMLLTFV